VIIRYRNVVIRPEFKMTHEFIVYIKYRWIFIKVVLINIDDMDSSRYL